MLNIQSFASAKEVGGQKICLDLLWPCYIYTIALKCEFDELNLFERTILRLMAIGMDKTESLSEYLTLDPEFIRFIQSRLEQKSFISNNGLTARGAGFVKDLIEGEDTTAFMYVDLVGGKLLPFANFKTPNFLVPAQNKGDYYIGAVGKNNILRTRNSIELEANPDLAIVNEAPLLDESDIRNSLKSFETIHRSTAILPFIKRKLPRLVFQDTLLCQPKPQKILLHCVCFMSVDGSMQVLNPFGYVDVSPDLTESLKQYHGFDQIKLSYLDKQARNRSFRLVKAQNRNSSRYTLTTDYPDIDYELGIAASALEAYERNIQSTQSRTALNNDTDISPNSAAESRFILAIHSAFECLFRRMLTGMLDSNFIVVLENSSPEQILEKMTKAAEALGLNLNQRNLNFLKINSYEIKSVLEGKVPLKPLFALLVFLSKHVNNNETKALRLVAAKYPTLVSKLSYLKSLRDPLSHGQSSNRVSSQELKEYWGLFESFVQAWLKGSKEHKPAQAAQTLFSFEPKITDIEAALQKYFTQQHRNSLDFELWSFLQQTEHMFQSNGVGEYIEQLKNQPAYQGVKFNFPEQISVQCITFLANFYQSLLVKLYKQNDSIANKAAQEETEQEQPKVDEEDLSMGLISDLDQDDENEDELDDEPNDAPSTTQPNTQSEALNAGSVKAAMDAAQDVAHKPHAGQNGAKTASNAGNQGSQNGAQKETAGSNKDNKPASAKSELVSTIEQKLIKAGFNLKDQALPTSLHYSSEVLHKAAHKNKGTLGIFFVLYVNSSEISQLSKVASKRPDLVANLVRLIELRGHGQGLVSAKDASAVRKEIYADCASFLGE